MISRGKIIIIEDDKQKQQVEPKKKIQIIKSIQNSIATKKINEPLKIDAKKDIVIENPNETDNSINYKMTNRTNKTTNTNLKGDLYFVVKDVKTGNIKKIKMEKEKINDKEYKVNPIIKYNLVQKQIITKGNLTKLIKGVKLEFKQLDRKTKTTRPIEINLLNKDNLNVKLLNNNNWNFEIFSSNHVEKRSIKPLNLGTYHGNEDGLRQKILSYIHEYFKDWVDMEHIKLITPIQLIDNDSINLQFHFVREFNGTEDYYIEKKKKYVELINLFNEKIEPITNPATENCVIYFFEQLHKTKRYKIYKLIKEQLEKIEKKKKTIYLNDLKNILNKFEITIYIYSINGLEFDKYSKNYTEISKLETIVLYIEDNHLYSVKSKAHKNHLTKRSLNDYNNCNVELNENLENEIFIASNVLSYNNCDITGKAQYLLHNNNKLITNNKNCNSIKNIFVKLGLDLKYLNTNFTSFIPKIKDTYNINVSSIFPFKVSNDVLRYKNNKINQNTENHIINIDKNKCFSNALLDLDFIPHFNILTDIKREYKSEEQIKEHYLYFIEVAEPTEIYFNNGFWFGWFINKYGGLKDVKVKYVFECKIITDKEGIIYNPFGVMIHDLYSLCETKEQIQFIKNSINAFIGQMLRPDKNNIIYKENLKFTTTNDMILMNNHVLEKYKQEYNGTSDFDDNEINIDLDKMKYDEKLKVIMMSNTDLGFDLINDNIVCCWNNKNIKNHDMGKDNKPLNIMIRNKAQSYLIDMIQKLKIKFDDIIEINTDCIYIKNADKYKIDDIKDEPEIFKGWKIEKGIKDTQLKNFNFLLNNTDIEPEKYFYEENGNSYTFNLEYAGGGKTHRIKKIIDEKLKANPKYSYIILSPFHDFLTDFRKNGYNAHTIANYKFNNYEIKEKNIYVDEWSICTLEDNLYLLRHQNKNYHFYGDIQQLKPVGSDNLNMDFIEKIATKLNTNWTNYRNTFTKEFYDDLIEKGNSEKKIKEMLLTYNSPIDEADKIIAYYNESVEKYNKYFLEKKKKKFDENEISLNIPIINTENRLPVINYETNETEYIYNRHSFNTIGKEGNNIIVSDDLKKYKIDKDIILKNFKLGYCITLYGAQGKTFKKIHYVNEFKDRRALTKQGALYTLISRLKFSDKIQYEIDTLNSNLNCDNDELNKFMKEYMTK